jgi:hypothetical protein
VAVIVSDVSAMLYLLFLVLLVKCTECTCVWLCNYVIHINVIIVSSVD